MILDLEGLALSAEEREVIRHPAVGGIIFFARNFESPDQIQSLVREVRQQRSDLVLCVDQEGGRVQRFKTGLTRFPPMQALTSYLTFKYGRGNKEVKRLLWMTGWLLAVEMRSLSLDLSFTPVLDIDYGHNDVIADRAFGSNAEAITFNAGAFIDGLRSAGMVATGKHFPGHGHVSADSHLELPIDERCEPEVCEQDMKVFTNLMDRLDAMMTAHVIYTAVDPKMPVAFSEVWLQAYLREQMGYKGVIISDDLCMEGAKDVGDILKRSKLALAAGCNVLLVCNEPTEAIKLIDACQVSDNAQSPSVRALAAKEKIDIPSFSTLDRWEKFNATKQELEVHFDKIRQANQ